MADVICRWRNATPKTVCEFVKILPHKMMSYLKNSRFLWDHLQDHPTAAPNLPDYFLHNYPDNKASQLPPW